MQKVFINFSNHPSQKWSEEQKEAAQKYGEIVDIPFPQINPEMTSTEVYNIANWWVKNILSAYSKDDIISIHVMGEMNFVFAFVNIAKAHKIPCFASTTERIVKEENGVKTSVFQFIQFRRYI